MAPDHDPDDDTFAKQLFEAARREGPSEVVKRRALRDASASKRAKRPWRWLLFAAALGAPIVVLVHLRGAPRVSGMIVAEPARERTTPSEAPSLPSPASAAQPAQTAEGPRALVPMTQPATNSPTNSKSSAVAGSAHSSSPTLRSATLEEELAMVDRARQALLDGNNDAALAGLAQYEKLATSRHLGAEAALLRIQIIAATGRSSEASRLATEFVAKNPNNPLVDRAKSFIREPARETKDHGITP